MLGKTSVDRTSISAAICFILSMDLATRITLIPLFAKQKAKLLPLPSELPEMRASK